MKEETLKPNPSVEDMLKHGYGAARQVNWLFIGLARAAGFEATEMLVTSRNESFFLPQVKDWTQLDDQVVWVRAGGQEYFLDPSAATYPFGILPWYEAGANGLIVSKDGGRVGQTSAPSSSQAVIQRRGDFTLTDDGELSGTLQVEYQGQVAALRREEYYASDEIGAQEKHGKRNPKLSAGRGRL
jgi:hypothetical protein